MMSHPTGGNEQVRIGQLVETGQVSIFTGPFGSSLHAHDYVPVGIPVIPTEAIGRRLLRTETVPRVAPETAERLARYKIRANDILFARRGIQATGYSAIAFREHEGWIAGTGTIVLRVHDSTINPNYLSFVLASDESIAWLKSHAVGAVMPNLNSEIVGGLTLRLPPLSVQRAIAEILGALDDKIELNRRMNETLEGMAGAIFKSWFVDFDPVRAKAAGRYPPGMDAETAALFPDRFVESPLGKIPKGWSVASLGDHADATKGLSYKGSGLATEGVPLHNLNSVYEGGGYKYEGIKFYNGEYRDRHIIRPGDLIVTNTEQGHDLRLIGYPAIVPRYFGPMGLFSHHLYRVRPLPTSPITPRFIFCLLMTQRFREEVTGHTNGTTVNMLPADGLQRPLFVVPPREVVQKFDDLVNPLFDLAAVRHSESNHLSTTRDALLPKLLNGEITVGELERMLVPHA